MIGFQEPAFFSWLLVSSTNTTLTNNHIILMANNTYTVWSYINTHLESYLWPQNVTLTIRSLLPLFWSPTAPEGNMCLFSC